MMPSHSCFIGKLDPSKTIHIIGGGYSGLIFGYFLKKKGIPFKIYEKDHLLGGKIHTLKMQNYRGETGAHAFFASQSMLKELSPLGLDPIFASKKLKKKIYRAGKFRSPPLSLSELIATLGNVISKRPPPYHPDMTISEFLAPLGSKSVQDDVFATVMVGIYGADTKDLHLQSIFKKVDFSKIKTYRQFFKAARKAKGTEKFTSVSFKEGMQELIEALQNHLKDEIIVGKMITELPANSIICTDAHQAAELLRSSHPQIAQRLNQITYLPISAATIITTHQVKDLTKSFGCLFSPRTYSSHIRGILANYEIFPEQCKEGHLHSYTFIMGTDQSLEISLENELRDLGLHEVWKQKVEVLTKAWTRGLPLYNTERFHLVEQIRSENLDNMAIFGNYIGGISLREIFNSAKETVEDL